MTYLQELQRETDSEVLCNSFGWLDDTCESFVLGERLIKKSVTETVRLGGTAATFGATYSPKGDLQKWVQATSIFNAPGLEFHGLVFLMGVGAPDGRVESEVCSRQHVLGSQWDREEHDR